MDDKGKIRVKSVEYELVQDSEGNDCLFVHIKANGHHHCVLYQESTFDRPGTGYLVDTESWDDESKLSLEEWRAHFLGEDA